VIGLYELFGNPTTELIETPGPLQEIESSKYNLAARTASSTGFLNVFKKETTASIGRERPKTTAIGLSHVVQ
jgi:hypothetical protein